MKYRTRVEEWIVESISDQHDYSDPEYPDEQLRSIIEFERKIARVLEDLTDDELVDMFYQHPCGYTFEELEEDIEYKFMQEIVTCIVTRADRMRLSAVDEHCNIADNLATVIDLYDRSLMTPAQIDAANTSEVFEAEHVIELALEVLHDKVVSCDTCRYECDWNTAPCDGCIDFSEWEK